MKNCNITKLKYTIYFIVKYAYMHYIKYLQNCIQIPLNRANDNLGKLVSHDPRISTDSTSDPPLQRNVKHRAVVDSMLIVSVCS